MDSLRDWSSLPHSILTLILQRLNAGVYHLLLRAVCPAWRLCLPLEPLQGPNNSVKGASISEKIFFHVSPLDHAFNAAASSWIVQVQQVGPNKWSFFHPMTGNRLLFPPGDHPDSMNLLDNRITEIGRSFSLTTSPSPPLRKVVRSSTDSDSLAFLALFQDDGKLAFYRPGLYQDWDVDHINSMDTAFEDVVLYNRRFYAVDAKGTLVMMDLSKRCIDPLSIVARPVIENGHRFNGVSGNYMHLIVSRGCLYLIIVRSLTQERLENEVYVLRVEDGRRGGAEWIRVTSIGDQVFFVCQDASFALSSSVLGSNCNNYIFLRGPRGLCTQGYGYGAPLRGMFAGIYVVFNSTRVMHLQFLSPDEWLFWPPPKWVHSPLRKYYYLFGFKIPVEIWLELANGLVLDV